MKKLLLTLTIISVSLCLNGLAFTEGFTVESIQGNYAFQATLGPKVIFLGAGTADGDGNISATGTGSFPAPFGERQIVTGSFEGTVEVNPDGTGVMPHTRTFEGINTVAFVADFAIMQAEVVDGVKLATEIFGTVGSGAYQGHPLIYTLKRLPD